MEDEGRAAAAPRTAGPYAFLTGTLDNSARSPKRFPWQPELVERMLASVGATDEVANIMCEDVHKRAQTMTETLSIRIDAETKKRLDALSKRSRRSKSFLAAEAITAYVESEEWRIGELQAGITELQSGREVSHEKVAKWLNSWGTPGEIKPPR